MEWNEQDEGTIRACREAIGHCAHYHVKPAPWFDLCLRMYDALEQAGMLHPPDHIGQDHCDGCAELVPIGGCRNGYQEAWLDESRSRVIKCRRKRP